MLRKWFPYHDETAIDSKTDAAAVSLAVCGIAALIVLAVAMIIQPFV